MAEATYPINAIVSAGQANSSVATWNSSTAQNTTSLLVNNDFSYNTINVSLNQTTTITGGVVTFQASFDGSTFFNIQGFAPGTFAAIGPTYTLQANTYATFSFNLTGIPYFQILLSTAITGTGAVTIGYAADSLSNTISANVVNTVTVTGTVAVTQSTSPWVENVSQFGGSAVVTGTGASGAGIPRVTVSNDSNVLVTQSTSPWVVNMTQVASTALGTPQTFGTTPTGVVIGTSSDIYVAGTRARSNQTTTAAGVVDVNIVGSLGVTNSVTNGTFIKLTDNTTGVNVIAGTNALKTDMSSVAGTATVTAAAGVQKVGVVGGTGTSLETTAGVLDFNLKNVSNSAVVTAAAGIAVVGVADSAGNKITSNSTTQSRSLDMNLVSILGATMSVTNPAFSSITDGTTKAGVIAGTTALKTDMSSVAGTATVTAAAGVQKVGVVGNAGAIFDGATGSAVPANALQVAGTDGANLRALSTDASGDLHVIATGTSNTSAASWTSATANNTAVTLLSANFSFNTLIVTINQTTTITGGAVNFEVSNDNSNWIAHVGFDVVGFGGGVTSYTLQASTYKVFKFNVGGFQYFRVRLSPAITGTGTVTIGYGAETYSSALQHTVELKDSGRTYVTLVLDAITGLATEALATMAINKGGTASSATTYTVTAGKTLRIQSMSVQISSASGSQSAKVRLRSAATVLATSPILITLAGGVSNTNLDGFAEQSVPDGIEIASGQQVGISHIAVNQAANTQVTATVVGYEY